MALTQDQIENLKFGDTLILNNYPVSFAGVYPEGTIRAMDDKADACCNTACFFPSKYLSVPPKPAPCRLFREGDMVKRRAVDGRTDPDIAIDVVYTVTKGEDRWGTIRIQEPNGRSIKTKSVFLELITPVEELEPYYVAETDVEFQVRMKYEDKDCLISAFRFKNIVEGYKQYHNMLPDMKQACERAEAERDRLNAEWRKEQSNG